MKRFLGLVVFAIVFLLLSGCATEYASTNSQIDTSAKDFLVSKSSTISPTQDEDTTSPVKSLIAAKVTKVIDGDTMKVRINGSKNIETIRLLLVDTPETVDPDIAYPQPYGKEASDFAKSTLSGQDVNIELDVSERDKYGRLLCYLYVGDKLFNEMLLEQGLARVAYVFQPNTKYVDQFLAIQAIAQSSGLGIWSVENYAQADGFHPEVMTIEE
ncbi:thermonuclease family protein [Cohnella sp. AR92]|uniref:thermonuclease family protein n=1 Tax=Cohnella sp. AR92 TaxID=648716 RepID=UPI000F8E9F61|nr:thermonuclease family protein [Cohnella sp. AR92]RUS44898.1 hypothetical protein ELR57_21820 [Cohnella sp. AR92]